MKQEILTCDQCGKEEHLLDSQAWFNLSPWDKSLVVMGRDFCSLKCVEGFSRARQEAGCNGLYDFDPVTGAYG